MEYDLVAVEDLDVKGLIELPSISRTQEGRCRNPQAALGARTLMSVVWVRSR